MRLPPRTSPHASNEQPETDRLGIPEHSPARRRTRHAPRPRVPPMPRIMAIALTRFREAERRLEHFDGDLTDIEAAIWNRIQSALRGGHAPGCRRHPPRDQPDAQTAAFASPKVDHSTHPAAPAPTMASLLQSIVQNDGAYLARVINKLKVPPSAIEDVTQEVLSAVAQSAFHYDASRGKLRTWLYRVAFHHSQNFLGLAYHRREILVAQPHDGWRNTLESMRNDAHPESELTAKESLELVWALIEKIEVNRRAVFVAYVMQQMPMADIAEELGIPMSTGWSQLQVARQEFADALRQHRAKEAFTTARKRR